MMDVIPTAILKELRAAVTAKGTSNVEILAGAVLIFAERVIADALADREKQGRS